MIIVCRNGHDIRPVAHVALPITIPACRDDRPVHFQSDRVTIACRDGHDIRPAAHVALPIIILACRDDRPVRFQSDRVKNACRDGHDIRPAAHVALAIPIPARRDNRSVRFQSDRVMPACRDFSFMQIPIANLIAALERILIPNNRYKRLCRSLTVLFRQQAFSLLVLCFFGFNCRVAVISSRLIRCYCAVVILGRQQLLTFLIYGFLRHFLRVSVIFQSLKRRFCVIILSPGQKRRRRRIFVFKPCRLVCAVLVFAQIGVLSVGFRIPPVHFRLHCQLIATLPNGFFHRRIVCQ